MSAKVTLEHAWKIIRKLKARESIIYSKHHKLFDVLDGNQVVLSFGISHTRKKSKPQSHLPELLRLNARDTKLLAECQISRDEYLAILRTLDE